MATKHRQFICLLVSPVEPLPDMRKTFDAEVTTTETRSQKLIINVDKRQDEARRYEIRPQQIAPRSERGGGADWFALFDIIRDKPVVKPKGTAHFLNVN